MLTPEQITEILTPFIGAKLRRETAAQINIQYRGANRINADVRGVTDAGVEMFFYSSCETVPFADIYTITLIACDKDGNHVGRIVFDGEQKVAA